MKLAEVKAAILSTYSEATQNQVDTLTQLDVDTIIQNFTDKDDDVIYECYTLAVENLEYILEHAKEVLKDNKHSLFSIEHGMYTILENRIEIPTSVMRGDIEDRWIGANNNSLLQGETTRTATVYFPKEAIVHAVVPTKPLTNKDMKFKSKKLTVINDREWDRLVEEVYGRPYSFQQQDGCKGDGFTQFTPFCEWNDDELNANESIPEVINGKKKIGVTFDVWVNRDPKAPLNPTQLEFNTATFKQGIDRDEYCNDSSNITLFWERSFYPCLQSVADDLCEKGILEKGVDYAIEI